jgi:hypothetical protein
MRAEMLTAVLAFVNPMSLPRRHRDLTERPDDHQVATLTQLSQLAPRFWNFVCKS